MSLQLKVRDARGEVLAASEAAEETFLFYEPCYREGDCLWVECGEPGAHLVLQLDDALPPVQVYLSGGAYRFPIPFGEKRVAYSPRAFAGEKHLLWARRATPEEVARRRNLALNPLDCHENGALYPHASANVETRGESVFAARNAIDGCKANSGHGPWPFTSWGINRDPAARLLLEFGRRVRVDAAVFYLRADFPHDAWWERATISFSDGSELEVPLRKTWEGQAVKFPERVVEWLAVDRLIKAEGPSPFPALTQLEVYGGDLPSGE